MLALILVALFLLVFTFIHGLTRIYFHSKASEARSAFPASQRRKRMHLKLQNGRKHVAKPNKQDRHVELGDDSYLNVKIYLVYFSFDSFAVEVAAFFLKQRSCLR